MAIFHHLRRFPDLVRDRITPELPTTRELAARFMTPCSPSWLFASSICGHPLPNTLAERRLEFRPAQDSIRRPNHYLETQA